MFKKHLVALKKMILTMPQCPLKTMGNLYTITNSAPRYLLSAWVISAWLAWNFTVWSSKRHKTIHSLKQALNRSIVGVMLGNTVKTNHTWWDQSQWGTMHWTLGSLGARGPYATEQVWEENMKANALAGKGQSILLFVRVGQRTVRVMWISPSE